jgi:hypothetical protein
MVWTDSSSSIEGTSLERGGAWEAHSIVPLLQRLLEADEEVPLTGLPLGLTITTTPKGRTMRW